MPNRSRRLALLLLLLYLPASAIAQSTHDRAYWRAIAADKYAVPEHESAESLAIELSSLLSSPDPELRDDLAYSILARWIYRGVLAPPALITLTDAWRANLNDGLGEVGTNSVLKRSFSALCLASMARREIKAPFMGEERYHQLVAESIHYLQAERDLRGYDAHLHWIHATAHTADLLAGLAENVRLSKDEAAEMLSAIDSRLTTAPEVFTQGEQDRLAAAVVALVRRPKFKNIKFGDWLTGIQDEDRDVWTKTSPAALARYQNHTYFLQALFARLAIEPDSSPAAAFRQHVIDTLKARLE